MKFAQFQRLSKQKFKRRTGMSSQAFYVIVNEVKEEEKNKKVKIQVGAIAKVRG